MRGAEKRQENRLTEIWYTAMLPSLKEIPTLQEFTGRKPDKRAELLRWIDAWDRVDRSLMRSH